jgi:hypothetical protein
VLVDWVGKHFCEKERNKNIFVKRKETKDITFEKIQGVLCVSLKGLGE